MRLPGPVHGALGRIEGQEMIYRPDKGSYVLSAVLCMIFVAIGLAITTKTQDEMGPLLVIASLVAWSLLWCSLAGQKVEITKTFVEKTYFWVRKTRIQRSTINKIAQGTNPIIDGPYSIIISGSGIRLRINLKLYPIALASAIEKML